MNIIDQALENPKVEALYKLVETFTPIKIAVNESKYWTNDTSNGVTNIGAGQAEDPAAALMHELLHAKMNIGGFKQYLTVTTVSDRGLRAIDVLHSLDNELQHHHMFPEFISAGFKPEAFYSDDDRKTYARLRREIEKMGESDDVIDYFLKFITIIAPGGHGTDQKRQQLRNFLFQRCGPSKRAILEAIESEILAWTAASAQDQSDLLHSILSKLDINNVWFATGKNFPGDGFFVGKHFSEISAEAFVQMKGMSQFRS